MVEIPLWKKFFGRSSFQLTTANCEKMQSLIKVFSSLLLICGALWDLVEGYPFKFLPRDSHDIFSDQNSYDKQMMLNNNLILPGEDYDARPSDESLPVQPWIKISQPPVKAIEVTAGTRVELECKASGSPPPQILWFAGSGTREGMTEYLRANSMDVYGGKTGWKGLARVVSKLVLECPTSEDAGPIYCGAVSSRRITVSRPTMLVVNDTPGRVNCSTESPPTITLYSPTRVATIGTTVVLPCRATGRPTPQISWTDNFNVPLSISTNSRHRVLVNGDLLIERLVWDDMGGYICTAKSGHHEQSVDTFLYPLRPEDDKDVTMN